MQKIEVDDTVYNFLCKRIRDFNDTPNAVLRRELSLDSREKKTRIESTTETARDMPFPRFIPSSASKALQQIIRVVCEVRLNKLDRTKATQVVADYNGVEWSTVADKYGRQLDLSSNQFDELIAEPNLSRLRNLLVRKFPDHERDIGLSLQAVVASI